MRLPSILQLWARLTTQQKVFAIVVFIITAPFLLQTGIHLVLAVIAIVYSLVSALLPVAGVVPPTVYENVYNRFKSQTAINATRRADRSASARQSALTQARTDLDALIGLQSVKAQVSKIAALMEVARERGIGGHAGASSLNFIFLGNPGTGKTTVARIIGDALFGVGALDSGHVIEVDRSGLVAEFVGQTATKTRRVAETAIDGVLFIDEAYTLSPRASQPGTDYGRESIDTLLKFMEDNRTRISVIVAGYAGEMQGFINSNPGLRSRFQRKIQFPDYSPEELVQVFTQYARDEGYRVGDQLALTVLSVFSLLKRNFGQLGNARFARNYFASCKEAHALRLADMPPGPQRSDAMNALDQVDIKAATEEILTQENISLAAGDERHVAAWSGRLG